MGHDSRRGGGTPGVRAPIPMTRTTGARVAFDLVMENRSRMTKLIKTFI